MTFEEALVLVPTHILLRPGIDKWQEGDEDNVGLGKQRWIEIAEYLYGHVVRDRVGRRPIPESVRKSMAESVVHTSTIGAGEITGWFAFEVWLLSTQGKQK